MAINTASGTVISIGTTLGDSEADAYTEIGYITNAGEFGRVYEEITFNSLGDRNVLKFKGQRNDGSLTLELGRDASDAGQAAAIAALDDDQDYNFRVVLNDATATSGASATVFYMKAKVFSYTTNISDPNSVVGSSMMIGIKSGTIDEIPGT